MDRQGKDSLLENLSAAALLGLLALLVASASLIIDSNVQRQEKLDLARIAGARVVGDAITGSGASARIYPLVRRDRPYYGTMASIGDGRASARVVAVFTADGRLDSIRLLGQVPADAPFGREGWFADFLGKGADDGFPSAKGESRKPDAVSGATDSYLATSQALARLSERVRSAADAAAKGTK